MNRTEYANVSILCVLYGFEVLPLLKQNVNCYTYVNELILHHCCWLTIQKQTQQRGWTCISIYECCTAA